MGYPKNYKKNCIVHDKILCYDLKPHTLVEDATSFKIRYNNTNDGESIATTSTNILKTIMDSNTPDGISISELDDVWLPAIISHNDYIYNKETYLNSVIGAKVYGVEELFKFPAVKFNNWDIESGSMDLCVDWIINTNLSAYDVEYGVLFWYKKNAIHKSSTLYNFDQIIPGTRIKPNINLTYKRNNISYTIATTDTVIKIDNNTIKRLDKDSSKFIADPSILDNGSFVFNTNEELELVPLSIMDSTNGLKFYIEDNTNYVHDNIKDYDLWISNGEFYSYFIGGKDKYDRQVFSTTKLPSRSYLSPSLYHVYRAIYNSLTINRIKTFDGLGSVYKLEKLKKLCYILATSPLIDRVNINYLQDDFLQNLIYNEYVNTVADTNTNTEIRKLITIVAKILQYYKQQSYFLQKQTLATNYITNKKQLYQQLLNKYGGYIKINTNTKIKYNKLINCDGPHALIDCKIKTFISKTLTPDDVIYNDMRIDFGDIYTESQMDPTLSASGCLCKIGDVNDPNKITTVPLANMAMPKIPEKIYTIFNKDISIKLPEDLDRGEGDQIHNGNHIQIDITANVDDSLSENVSYSWSLVDGPDCLRFSDFATNGNTDVMRRNRTSADFDPSIFVKQTGLYTIQGITSFGSTLKSIENIRVYVHDNSNQYEPGKTLPTLMSYNQDIVPNKYRAMVPNFRKIAFNKNGMVWFIDSDMYVSDNSNPIFVVDRRFVDKKISITNYQKPDTLTNDLHITFKPNNTVFKLQSIKIELMRDSDDRLSQCKSYYEPRLARQRDTFGAGIITGAARFYRINREFDSFDVRAYKKVGENWERDTRVSFSLPKVSTVYAPNIYTYGGYSKNIVEKIGVEIPYHPIKTNNTIQSYDKIPLNTPWGVDPTDKTQPVIDQELASGYLASAAAPLAVMSGHNNYGGIEPFYRCHLVDIPVTGYTTFDKGFFHPNSGWYYYTPTGYNPLGYNGTYSNVSAISSPNISSIQKFDVEKYKSYNFIGPGFYNLRSINNSDNNVPMEYRSAVRVDSYADASSPEWYDQDRNYGIRNFNGLDYKNQEMVDDFILIKYEEAPVEFDCNYTPTYQYVLMKDSMNALKLKDIEIKINLMNIPNPKNIVMALEVYNPTLDSIVSSNNNIYKDKIFIPFDKDTDRTSPPISWLSTLRSNGSSLSDVTVLDFLDKLKNTNTTNKPNTSILYLYNQENLDNYGYHFSLTFSDNMTFNNTFSDENKTSVSGVSVHSQAIANDSVVQPTLSPTGYSEKQTILHKQIIKNNRINLIDTALAKFKNLPLRNTVFTLKLYVLGPEEKIQSLDNTVHNSELSGLNVYESRISSNTILSSICNWSVIAHTASTIKYTTQDYLGTIDYESEQVSRTGYNYIADFTNKEYLLPKINLNAPYNYISTNTCRYPGNIELSKPLTYRQILFPFVGWFFTPFYSLVGALAEISILQASFAIGGRGDPIISMLYDIRFQRQQQEQERFYFKPVYDGTYPGSSSKALIQISKDRFNWYRLEVPIYKYNNTAILAKNRYKYIRLHKDMITPLSNFSFTRVANIYEIVNKNVIVLDTTMNVPLTGLTVPLSTTSSVTLKENDLVYVANQTTVSQNGVYYARSGSWIRYPDPGIRQTLQYDRLWGNNTITNSNIEAKKIITIPGSRLYNLYDIDDTIAVMKQPGATGTNDLFTNTIAQKALIYFNDQHNTVLTLNSPLPDGVDSGYIGKTLENSNSIVIYKDNVTKNDKLTVGKWGLTKSNAKQNHINKSILDVHSVATAEGSIGYGSQYLEPPMYSFIDSSHPNKIFDTDEILNNHENNKNKFNSIMVQQSGTTTFLKIDFSDQDVKKDLLVAYPYRLNSAAYLLDALNNYSLIFSSGLSLDSTSLKFTSGVPITGIDLDRLKRNIQNNLLINNEEYSFIDLKSDKFKTQLSPATTGEIIIENDYNINIPTIRLLPDQTGVLNTRLTNLNSQSDTPLDASNINFDTISSITDLELFYSNLPADPSGCFRKGYYPTDEFNVKCSGYRAKKKLSELYAERNEILSVFEENNKTPSGVLPYYDINIAQNPVSQAININYIPKQYYFISIDPEQECSLSYDVNVKILKTVTYECLPVVEFYQFPECDAVCKDKVTSPNPAADEILTGNGLSYTNNRVAEEKAKYPGVDWGETENLITMDREFFLSCDNNIRDTLVKVRETYIVPRSPANIRGKVKNIFNLNDSSQVFIKFRNIPRKLKTTDNLYSRYVYDYYGRLGPDIIPPKGGPMYNNYLGWRCVKVNTGNPNDPYPDKTDGQIIPTPTFYQWMNEMIFRGFFGSTDGVENKNDIMDSKEIWEWIPYEYF